MSEKTLNLIKESEARWVDLRFTDTKGKEQHVSIPIGEVGDDFFVEGKMFDGSSIAGWKGINESDMILMPDDSTASRSLSLMKQQLLSVVALLSLRPCKAMSAIHAPSLSVQRNTSSLLVFGDTAFFGPEPEFFRFDDIKWGVDMSGAFYKINSEEAAWSSGNDLQMAIWVTVQALKAATSPYHQLISLHDLRAAMCTAMEQMGLDIEVHHHEVGTAGQCEIGVRFDTLVKKADQVQILKYCVHNVAHAYGKTATFMPKPVVGDNGSGMHCHMSFSKDGENQFAGDAYAGLSEMALHYIGGIIKHAKSLNAFANASTNSYKRLIPGFEAPVMLAYSARNRSAAIRIPYVSSPRGKRIEVRFGDPTANPYLMFAAFLMAGLDGIKHKMHPGDSADKDLYDLPAEEAAAIPQVCGSLREALENLDADREFLTVGGVFTDDMIDAYIDLKMEEVYRVEHTTHPVEFDMYYSV